MVLVLVIGDMHIPHRSADLPKKFKALLQPGKIQHVLCTGNVVDKLTYDYLRTLASDVHVVRGDFDDATFMPNVANSLPETKNVKIGQFEIGLIHGHQVVPWGDSEALCAQQRQQMCDVLISGHTHQFSTYEIDGKLFINPGSATGSFSPTFGLGKMPTPSVRALSRPSRPGTSRPRPHTHTHEGARVLAACCVRTLLLLLSLALTQAHRPHHASAALSLLRCTTCACCLLLCCAQFVLMDVQQQRIVVYVYELVGDEVKVKKIEHQKAGAEPVQTA